MSSTEKPKLAYLTDDEAALLSSSSAANPYGVDIDDDSYTGKWEISLIPTTDTVSEDRINVGV
jgi:hypothetical protein